MDFKSFLYIITFYNYYLYANYITIIIYYFMNKNNFKNKFINQLILYFLIENILFNRKKK